MGKKKVKNKRKTELRIIFFIILVAALLFIISTYAWFSTQRNVSITNLSGIVEVAEGLEISLDALNWANEIVLGENMSIIKNAYPDHRNISPTEMLPVSTLGKTATTKDTDLKMIRGKVTNSKILSNIIYMDEKLAVDPEQKNHNSALAAYPGYFAFDIFLKNSSKQTTYDDVLQLNYDSSLQIIEKGNDEVGLQNTARVALAKFGGTAGTGGTITGVSEVNANQKTILEETGAVATGDDVYITDVAIWEPNSNDHVEYIVNNNNMIRWSAAEEIEIFGLEEATEFQNTKFNMTTRMPTYALKASSVNDKTPVTIDNIYNWDSADKTADDEANDGIFSGHVEKQMTLQTSRTSEDDYSIKEGVQNLISTSSTATSGEGAIPFSIAPNCVIRLRVYVWLEGQDVDCINYASHGGGITLNLGLVKGSKIGATEETIE